MNDESATSAIDEITRLVSRYAKGFAEDPLATIDFYALPMIYVGPDAVSVVGSRAQAVAFVEGILERLRPTGFSHTTVERCFVKLLHRSVALCGVRRHQTALGRLADRADRRNLCADGASAVADTGTHRYGTGEGRSVAFYIAAGNANHRRREL